MAKTKGATSSNISKLLSGEINNAFGGGPGVEDDQEPTNVTEPTEDITEGEDAEVVEDPEAVTADEDVATEEVGEDGEPIVATDDDEGESSQGYVMDETVQVGDKTSKVIYSDNEALKKGVIEKEKMILRQGTELEHERELRIDAEAKARTAASSTPGTDKAKFVQDQLPEEFKGRVAEDFEDVADLRKFTKVEAKAEAAWENKIAEEQRLIKEMEAAQAKLIKEAQESVSGEIGSRLNTIPNSEGKAALKDALATEVQVAEGQTVTYEDITRMMAEIDKGVAEIFLDGVVSRLNGETSKKVGEAVKKGASNKKTTPKTPASHPSTTPRTQLRGRAAIASTLSKKNSR